MCVTCNDLKNYSFSFKCLVAGDDFIANTKTNNTLVFKINWRVDGYGYEFNLPLYSNNDCIAREILTESDIRDDFKYPHAYICIYGTLCIV